MPLTSFFNSVTQNLYDLYNHQVNMGIWNFFVYLLELKDLEC